MARQLQSPPPHLSTDCRSISQISLFGCELNSILGIHIGVGEAVVGIRRAAARIAVVNSSSASNNEGKTQGEIRSLLPS